jgi:tripartite-type tricarboxylate transporter receptor subunit TctC
VLLAGAGSAVWRPAVGQSYPNRVVRILFGFGAGGSGDALARLYAQKLQQILGATIIVDNRPGGASMVAMRALLASPADGYTVMLATNPALVLGPAVSTDLFYDPLKDLSLIGMVATAPGILYCNPRLPFESVDAFVAYAKAHPGRLNYGSSGVGSSGHFQMEYLAQATGTDLVHVPYRSDQEVAREVMTGTLQAALTTVQPVLPMLGHGNLRALAVTGSQRLGVLPDVPCLAETGISRLRGIDYYSFYGMIGPAGLSAAVVERLNAAINQVSAMPDIVGQMRDTLVFEPAGGTPDGLRNYIAQEIPKWREVGRSMNLSEFTR